MHKEMLEVYRGDCLNRSNIARWCRFFENGRINLADKPRSGRPIAASTSTILSMALTSQFKQNGVSMSKP